MLPDGNRIIDIIEHSFRGLDLYYTTDLETTYHTLDLYYTQILHNISQQQVSI